jgi:gliding motility-associated-like protein
MANFTLSVLPSKHIFMSKKTFTLKGALLCLLMMAFGLAVQPVLAQAPAQAATKRLSKEQINKLVKETSNSISFIENKGQWDPNVKVAGNTNIGNMYITNDHIHFLSFEKEEHEGEEHEESAEDEEREAEELSHQEVHGWGIYLDGSNPDYTISKEKEMPTKYNYFVGESYHASNASSFGELTLNNIYNGIDLRIYSQHQHVMEFDWMVNAGADFNNIKMRFKGQEGLRIDEQGNLAVKLEFDEVKFDIPEAYQIIDGKKVMVKMAFDVKGDVATFKALSKIDNTHPLIIDPSLKWGTWFDNNSDAFDEYIFAVDIDNQGNMYCGGNINVQLTSGAGNYINPASLFGFSNTYAGSVDGIIYELRFDGASILAITYFGSTADDRLYGLAMSPDKSRVFVSGKTDGTLPSGSTTAFDNTRNNTDGFVGVFNSTLSTLFYSTYLGDGGDEDEMVSIRPLSNTSFVVGGTVNGSVPATGTPDYIENAYDATYSGSTEMYIAKFNNLNSLVFGTYIGGSGTEQLNDVQIFSDGAIAFSGSSGNSASFPALFNNAAQGVGSTTGGLDGVLGVLPANGGTTVQMLSRFGGTSDDEFYGLTIDAFDTLYVTGFTSSTNFYLGPNATGNRFQTTKGVGQDAFVGKFPRGGWASGSNDPWAATYFGGGDDDRGNTLRTYTPYALMIFGETQSTRYPFNKNLDDGGTFFDSTFNGGTWDIFYMVLGTDLKTQYFGTLIGGDRNDYIGQTGVPHGSNHFVVEGDSLICLGTTVHSRTLTPNPVSASGVFDPTSGPDTDNDDLHLIFKWRIGILLNFDYGDAPSSYGNPNHVIFQTLKLGSAAIDREDFPNPTYKADGDDLVGTTPDDEDAIAGNPTQVLIQDTATRFTQTVNVTNGTGVTAILMGWIDFNKDGDFNDAGEVDTAIVPAGATSATLRWTGFNSIFQNIASDTTYMRLRITTQSSFFVTNPSPTANAANGEVEDYLVIRYHCVNLASATIDTNGTTSCGSATGSLVITNTNLIPGVQYGVYYSRNGGPLQGPFYYTTASGTGTLTISGLSAGTYTSVEVFHPTNRLCGYTLPGNYVITDPASPPAPSNVTATPNPVCTGTTVQFSATGQPGATYSWTGPQTFTSSLQNPTRSITAINQGGTYLVTQTVNGCTSPQGSVTLVVTGTPVITGASGTNPTTCSGTQGTITLTGLLANQTYTVFYTKGGVQQGPVSLTTNGSGNIVITGLTAGTYTGFQVSIAGCSSAVNNTVVTLVDPTAPPAPLTATVTPNPVCTGNTVNFAATTNQVGTITWNWTGPNGFTSTQQNPSLAITTTAQGGSYSVTQTINNCTSPARGVTLTVNQTPTFAFSSSSNPTTCGGTNGSITISGLSSNTTYSVSYTFNGAPQSAANFTSNGSGLLTITGLAAGAYTNITVTLNGCSSAPLAGTITLSPPSTPATPAPTSNTPVCTGNTISLSTSTVAGGSYSWTGPSSFTSSVQNPTRASATTAMAGSYCVVVTVAGCPSAPGCTNVVVNTTPAISSGTRVNPTTCSGSDGSITLNGLANNTTYSVSYSKDLVAQGPFTLTSNGSGQILITGLSAGSYTNFTVTANGCTSAVFNGPLVLADPTAPATPSPSSNSPVCSGTVISLSTATVAGGSYSWTGPLSYSNNVQNPSISNATTNMSGSYCVVVTVANCASAPGCTNVVVNPTPVIVTSGFTNPTTCGGNDGTITLNGLTANTTYSVRYTRNGILQGPFNLTSNASGVVTISGLNQGNYSVITVTLNGCQSSPVAGPLNLTDPTAPAAPTAGSNSPVCTGGTINLTANGNSGATYNWTGVDGDNTFSSNLQNPSRTNATLAMDGEYCVTQTVAGCISAPACVTVVVNQTPAISTSTSTNPTTCSGTNGTIVLNGLVANTTYTVNYLKNLVAQGPFSITTNASGVLTITGLSAGSYTTVTVTRLGCTSSPAGPFTLTDPSNPAAPTVGSNSPVCSGGTINLTASGSGSSFSWTGPNSFTSSAQNPSITSATTGMSGSYCATQTVNNCVSPQACTTVTVNQTPSFSIFGSSNPTTCGGSQGTITLDGLNNSVNYSVTYTKTPGGAQGPFTISSNGSGQLVITGLTAGLYSNFVVTLVSTSCPSAPVAGPVTLTDPTTPAAPSAGSNSPVCSGNSINLTANGQSGATYSWTGPNGYSANVQNPVITSATTAMSGSYCVTQTVVGCTSTPTCINVVVNQTPSAPSPSASPNPICSGNTLTLTATGEPGATFNWTYPDGGTAIGSPVTRLNVTTGMSGIYSVTQTVNGCTSTSPGTVNVVVNQTPAAPSAGASPNPICSGNTLTLTATGQPGATFTWTYPDGGGATGNPVTRTNVTTGMSGLYSVTQTVSGCTSTTAGTVNVTVNQTPSAPSAFAAPNPICSGNTLTLTATGQVGATFTWTYPDGGGTTGSPVTRSNVTTGMSGIYSVTQTVSGCTSTTAGTVNVTVNQTPAAPAAGASPNPICSGNTLTLTATGEPSATFNWTFPDGGGATGSPVTRNSVTTAMAGVYNVTQTVNGCTSTTPGSVNVVINQTPAAPTAAASPNPICSGNTLTLTANGLPGATFTWTYPDGGGITGNPVSRNNVTTGMAGVYSVTQTVNNCTSTTSGTVNVTINQTPAAPVASSNSPVCTGNTITLSATGVVGATFNWTYPDGPTAVGTPQSRNNATTGMAGTYSVTQTVNGCTSTTAGTTNVVVNTTPGIPSASSNSPVCLGDAINLTTPAVLGASYIWSGPNGFSSNLQSPTVASAAALNAGTYSVTITVNGCSSTSPGTTSVVVNNCAPIAVRDVYSSCAVSPITGNILTNDIDPSGDGIQVVTPLVCGIFSAGSFNVNSTGAFTFTPPAAFNGVDSICYKVCNVNFPTICDTGIAVFDYTCVNLPPVAVDDNYNMNEDDTLTGTVTTNDYDPDGGIITVNTTPTCNPQNGTVTLLANGNFTYIPNANFNGLDTFCYQICDNGSPIKCANAIVVINVIPVNDPPFVPDTTVTTPEDSTITVCLPITDVEVNTQSHNVNICGNPVNGTIISGPTVNNPLTPRTVCLTYRPNTNFNGSDSICLIVCDNGTPAKCDTTITRITVTPVNDPPVANNDSYTTNEDQNIVTSSGTGVRNNDSDPADGLGATSLTVTTTPVVNVSNGTLTLNADGSFTYVPNANFSGTDSFQYRVCDSGVGLPSPLCDTATAYITVVPVNDPPFVPDTTTTTPEDSTFTVCLPITDVEVNTQTHSVNICGAPQHGTIVSGPNVNNPLVPRILCYTYTPTTNYYGTDSICLIVCDNGVPVKCDTTITRITITPVNDPPVANNDNYTTTEDQNIITSSGTGVRNNDSDPADGLGATSLTVTTTPVVNVSNGTLTLNSDGSFTYVPNANFSGTDSFQYRVCDSGVGLPSPLCDTATAYITVTPVNDPPFVPDTTTTTPEDSTFTVCLPITDVEVNTQSYNVNICGLPLHGTIVSGPTINNPLLPRTICYTYTPTTNYYGADSICLIVCDNGVPSKCDTTVTRITITPVNDPPVAINDNYTTNEDVTLNTTSGTGVRNNDSDPADGLGATSLTVTTAPVVNVSNGTLTLNANGSFTYVPNANFVGTDSFQYRVCDSGVGLPSPLCDTATAYITILPVNDPPFVPDTIINTCEDCGTTTVCIPVSDNDPGQTHYVAATYCGPNSGIASYTLNGPTFDVLCVSYTPNVNFNGSDSICLIVCDNGSPNLCDTTRIRITVDPVNDPPIAVNDNYTTTEDVTINTTSGTGVRNNDSDPGDNRGAATLTVNGSPVVAPANGTLTLNADGSFTYVPNANYNGTDSFQYRVCDSGTGLPAPLCDTATAYITITPVNDPPFVPDTTVTTPEDTPIVVCIPITDLDVTNQHVASFCDAPDNGVITSGPIVDNNAHTVCITYRPNANFNGNDSICLTVCDNGIPSLCDNTIIRIIVTPVNDPPIAVNDNYTTTEDSTINVPVGSGVRVNDNDNADNNPVTSLTVTTTPLSGPTHGTITLNPNGSFTYDPDTNYFGIDSFQYRICDAGTPPPSLCDTATAYITISPFNDPPIIIDTPVTTCEDCPITVCIPFTDEDVTDIHVPSLLCSPVNGTVSNITINNTTRILCFDYVGYTNINGEDSLCIVVCDNGVPVKCDTSYIHITIDPVNDPPYADTIYVTTYENIPVGVNVASATGDVEGDPLSYSYGGVVPGGGTYYITGNGAIVFVPDSGFTGTAVIPYGVCDLSPYPVNVLCDSAAIIVTVLPQSDTVNNHAPVANNDYATTPMNNPVVINELANDYDPDGDPLQVTVTGLPANGVVTVNPNGTVNYTPNTGYFGYDTIRYVICDPVGSTQPRPLCDDALIIISITRDPGGVPNDAPVAVDDFANICADATTVLNVLRNDYDPNGDALTSVTIIRNVTNGALVNSSLGIYSYDPNNNFAGTDTFVYRVCDNGSPSLCDTATAIITVAPIPVITPSAPSASLCSGDNLSLTFTSNVNGTLINWTATNGTSGTGNINTTLTNTGTSDIVITYTVIGSTGSGCGSAPLTIPVTVKPRPTVNYVVNNTIFCSGDQVVINLSTTIPNTTYTWSGSNGSSGTGNLITDNPVNPGPSDSTVTYTINSLVNGCAGTTITVPVTVKPRPVITANPASQSVCSGTPITINLSSNIQGTTVLWTGSNGNSGNTFTINDSPINNGTSNLTVTYTINSTLNGCAGTTAFATVTVRPNVTADAGTDKSVTACSGSCVTLGGSPSGNGGSGTLTYAWSPNLSINDSTLANPTACNVSANTTYTLLVTDALGCSATDAITITVTPSSLTAEAGSGGALCLGSGDSVMLGGFPTAVGGTPAYTYTWSPLAGLNLTNPANPEAFPDTTTTYYLTVTDAQGCTSTDSAIVRVYPTLTANAGIDTSVCATFPAQLGGTPTATGGFGSGYTYIWSPTGGVSDINAANPTATPSILTTYTVVVFDPNGCSATDNVTVAVRPNPIAQAGPDKSMVNCAGDSVTIGDVPAVTGGTAPYTYRWTPTTGLSDSTSPTPVVKGITVTTVYTLLVTDATGCTGTDQVRVNVVNSNLQANAGNDESVCSNNNCVQLGGIPTAVGGTAPFTYAWSNANVLSDASASNPLACPTATTTFTVTITDSKGCTATDSETVTVNPAPTANAGPDTSVCSGSAIQIGGNPTAVGGTPGYTYNWLPTQGLSLPNVANPSASPTIITTYQVVVIDTKGCSSLDEVTVTPRTNPVVDAGPDKNLVGCVGDTVFIGGLPVVTSGGTAPYTYDWTYGTGLSDSTIANPLVTGIASTTSYQLIVTDTFGCSGVDFVVVNVLPSTLQANAGSDQRICAGAGTQVTLGGSPTAVGGTSPYTYNWGTGAFFVSNQPNPTVSPTSTTTYYVTVTDSKGCRSVDTVVVTVTPSPVANAGVDTTLCSGFCVNLGSANTGSGGTGALQYAWTPTQGLFANNTANPQACPLVTTTYTVLVTDANGCTGTDNVTITIRSNPVADAGQDVSLSNCSADSITIGGSPAATGGAGGYDYQWSPATGLSADSVSNPVVKGLVVSQLYTLVVTDANGCSAEDAVLVTVTSGTLSAEAGVGGSYCAGSNGTVTLGASPTATGGTPGYSYTWSPVTNLDQSNPANPIASPDTTTTYYVSVTDSKGCIAVDSVTVTVQPAVTVNAGRDTAICAGLSVTLGGTPTATGGTQPYTYTWAPGNDISSTSAANPTATPVATTLFTVRVTDVNGCTASDAVLVTVNALPVVNAGPDRSLVACSGDSVRLGGSPSATGTGPFTYQWNPSGALSNDTIANPYVRNLGSSATYTLVVTNANGCTASDQVTVNVTNSTFSAEAGNNVAFCEGASVSILLGGQPTAVGGTAPYTYTWSPATGLNSTTVANPLATPLVTTTYAVVITDGTGCIAEDTVRITINPRPVVNAGAPDTICAGSIIQLGGTPSASGGTGNYTYTWTPGTGLNSTTTANPLAQPLATETYVLSVTDALGCSNSASVAIRVNQNPVANAGTDQTVVACPTACVTLGGTPTATGGGGGYLYAWAPASGLSNTGLSNPAACNLAQSLTYSLTVTDVNGCTATDQVLVTVTQSTLTADAGDDKSICAGTTACVTIGGTNAVSGGTAPYIIDWSPVAGICNSNSIANPQVNPTDTTTYVLLVTDAYGCIAVDSMVLFANPAVTASVLPDTAICAGGSALLGGAPTASGGSGNFTYTWNPGVGLSSTVAANPIATPATVTTYTVTVTDAVGCTASASQTVSVNPAVCANAGADRAMTNCPGSFTQLGGSPTGGCGSGNYSYAWSPSANLNGSTIPNPIVTGLTVTTTFSVTVTDNATGCFAVDEVVVTVNQTNLTADAGTNKVFCANSNGCVTIGGNPTAVGGQPPYLYQWAPITNLSDATIANPCANPLNTTTYYLTVTDQLGCNMMDSMTVVVSPLIAVNAGVDTAICTGTSIVLGGNPAVVGGTTPYSYAWSLGAFPSNIANPTATPVSSSSYTLTVTDSLGCTASDVVNVSLRALPIANAGADAAITACALDSAILGGSPTASGTVGPYSYSWYPPVTPALSDTNAANPTVKQLGFTTVFTVTVTDSFGCKASDNVQVTVLPNTLFVDAGSNFGSLCSNANTCVTLGGPVSGGEPPYTYQWFGGANTPTSLNSTACPTLTTVYTLVVTDNNGCQAADSTTVVVNTPPSVSFTGLSDSICVDAGNVLLTGSPAGGTFFGTGVTGNVFQPAVVGEGYWCVQYVYTDPATGCTNDTFVCTVVTPLPAVTASGFAPAYCQFDSAVTLVGSPAGGIFSGSTGLSGQDGSIFNPATAPLGNNTITYTYTDNNTGCTNTYSFVINVKGAPSIAVTASADTSCFGSAVTFTPNFSFDVFNIIWSLEGGSNVGSGTSPFSYTHSTTGDYCLIATAINTPNGCVSSDTICSHVNIPPVAVNDQAETCEELPVTFTVLTNDTDAEGNTSTVTIISAGNGSATVNGDSVTYTPRLNYNGADTIVYQICNTNCANACDTAEVYVSICPVNDPPVITDVIDTILINTSDTVCPPLADVDDAINTLTLSTVNCGTINGTVSILNGCVTYTPTTDWIGTQVICVSVCDTSGACDTGTITIVVLPVNNPPVAQKISVFTCDSTSVGVNVAASTSDPDGNLMTYSYGPVSGGSWTVTGNGSGVYYNNTPGVYTMEYYVCDISNIPVSPLCDTNIIRFTVIPCDGNNNPPVANDDEVMTAIDSVTIINELANDFDPDGDPLNVTILSGPGLPGATASLNGDNTVTYTSPVSGTDTVVYAICDPSGACDTAIIVIHVATVINNNHPPVAVDDFGTTDYQTPVTVPVQGNDHDPDGDDLTTTSIPVPPTGGTATVNQDGTITYTPTTANAYNPDTFTYVICDDGLPVLCDTATVVIYINNSVVAVNECTVTGYNRTVVIDVLANDYDPDVIDSIWVAGTISLPNTQGTAFVDAKGMIRYIPNADTCGFIDTFAYVLVDEAGSIDTGYVCVEVLCCAAPIGVTDTARVITGDSVAIVVSLNDTITGGTPVHEVIVNPQHGTAYFVNDSTVMYVSDPGYCGADTFTYAGENVCGFDTALVIVNVICNTKPVALADTQTICLQDTITFNPLGNDTDADGNAIRITGIGTPSSSGLINIQALTDSTITISSNGTASTISLDYYICDNGLPVKCDTATIQVRIIPCPEPVIDPIYDTLQACVTTDSICIDEYVTLPANTSWTITAMCEPANGTLTFGNHCFSYVPNTGFYGNDTMCVTVCTDLGNCTTAPVIITTVDCIIQAVDEPCDLDTAIINTPITVDVLANDIIPVAADTTVTLITQPVNGVAVVNANNTVTYTPNNGFKGQEQFSYQVCAVSGSYIYCDTANICITVVDTAQPCFIPNGFSPNGDGVNDTYVIPCKDRSPQGTVRIFNRWGVEVWFSEGAYEDNFAGKNMEGIDLPDGTYYIIYEYNDGTNRREAKFVVIHR